MKNRLWLYSAVMLYTLAISAFSPLTHVQSISKMAGIPAVSALPVEPGVPYRTIEDANSQATATEKRALSGDNFSRELLERPFTSLEMVYLPDTDIQTASISNDDDYFYFTIQLARLSESENKLTATYGVEIDINKDGRGDYLMTAIKPDKDWSSMYVKVFFDRNMDVGGLTPIRADPSSTLKSDGYEVALKHADSAFARLGPDDETIIQLSISKLLIGDAKQFLWNTWADSGLRNLRELDYNDRFTSAEAGSPIKSDKTYPVKALSALDNTCRVPYGFATKVTLPGMCAVATVAPEKPSKPRLPGTNPIN